MKLNIKKVKNTKYKEYIKNVKKEEK